VKPISQRQAQTSRLNFSVDQVGRSVTQGSARFAQPSNVET
jgi:hypothetical protein